MNRECSDAQRNKINYDPQRSARYGIYIPEYNLRTVMIWGNVEHIAITQLMEDDIYYLCHARKNQKKWKCTYKSGDSRKC